MAELTSITQRASEFVFELFKEKLPEHLVYHNYQHTQSVAETARKLAKGMKLGDDGIEIVTLAGWLHDTGYTEVYAANEDVGKRIAQEFLRTENYPEEKIEYVLGCIEATKMPQRPKNLLEEIVCDADLSSLGKKTFSDRSKLLRIEWEKMLGKVMSDEDWMRQDLDFLTSHKFFTRYAQEVFDEQKLENIRFHDRELRKYTSTKLSPKDEVVLEKVKVEKEKLARAAEKETRPERGIETMFKIISGNHMDLSIQADRKAETMIQANSLIISFIVGFVIRKLDESPELAIPGFFLLAVCVLTIIFAVLAIRPKVSHGKFTREDIQAKRVNLLFFGNFYKMKLDDFEWGVRQMMGDKEYLYGSMIKDNYFLGKVIGRKYEFLRVSYNIFMFGLIIAVLLFLIAAHSPELFGGSSTTPVLL